MVALSWHAKCEFGNEFTCNSGHCVALHKRCDFFFDCNDRSDEEGCKLIQKPDTYRKVQPPEPRNRSEALPITTEVEIITIENIKITRREYKVIENQISH